jgi:hypothetical protein
MVIFNSYVKLPEGKICHGVCLKSGIPSGIAIHSQHSHGTPSWMGTVDQVFLCAIFNRYVKLPEGI